MMHFIKDSHEQTAQELYMQYTEMEKEILLKKSIPIPIIEKRVMEKELFTYMMTMTKR